MATNTIPTYNAERERELRGIFDNFMCNVSVAYKNKDWSFLKMSYATAQEEREMFGFPLFIGYPNLEHETGRDKQKEDDLKLQLQYLNDLPEGKDAIQVLKTMGERHDPSKLAVLELGIAKAEVENLESKSRDDLAIYIPRGTSGEDLFWDLCDVERSLSLDMDMARRIMEEPPEVNLSAEEYAESIINRLTQEQTARLELRTVEYPD